MGQQEVNWRKSTRSSANGGECVEVGNAASRVLVRDTKDQGGGAVLGVPPKAWERFLESL